MFYQVALDPVGPLPETLSGNKYVLVAINHYFKWCETRLVKNRDAVIITKFFEEEIVCQFGVPKYVFIDNGREWIKKLMLCVKTMG